MLTVLGDLLEDVIVWTAMTRPGTDNPATVWRGRGGSAANVAAHAAAAVPTRFVGRIGDDRIGDALVAELRAGGVDVKVQRGGRTGTVVVVVDATGERTMFPDRGAAAELGPVDEQWLAGTAVLHLPVYGLAGPTAAIVADAASVVRSWGGVVTVDLSAVSLVEEIGAQRLGALLGELDPAIVFANAEEAAALGLGATRPRRGAYVVKDGPRPARVIPADGPVEVVAANAVEAVRDTTGAGDAFAAGFLAAWIGGAPWADCGRAGHDAATAVLARPGAGGPP